MAGKNGLLDNDFDDDEDEELRQPTFPGGKDEDPGDGTVDIEIKDDTPEADKDRWHADKVPTDGDGGEEDEATRYSKRVKDRIGKETARFHAERRAKEDRERQLNEAVVLAQRLISENNQLKGLIENGEKVFIDEHNQRLSSQINAAKAAIREAHEAGDINGQIAAQENMSKLTAQLDRISVHRPQALPRMDDKMEIGRIVQQPQQQQVQPEPAAIEWQDKNRWFGRDDVMTSFAMVLHKHMTEREGILPTDGKPYWERLDTEMRKRFPERFQNGSAPRRSDTVVAPVSRSSGGGQRRVVTLTESQVSLARRIGLTPQQYAEQLAAEQTNGQKEWTHGRK